MANIGNLTVVIDGQTFKLKRKLRDAETQVTRFTKKGSSGFKSFKQNILSARSAVIALGAVFALFGKKILGSAIKEAADFQESLGEINSLLEDSNLVFGEFGSGIRDLSKEFGRSKIDLAKGLKDIIDATIPASEAMNVLTASTKLAVGGFTDVKTATSAVISTFQLYGDELRDVEDASDFLFATQKRGRLTLEDLAKNIGTVIGVAKSAGLSLEDLGQGFAAISRVAGSASKTATQFRSLISVFTKQQPIEAQRLAFEKFGVVLNSTSITHGKFVKSILKFKNASAEDLSIIFKRSRALRAAAAIINQAEKAQDDYNQIVERAELTNRTALLAQELWNQELKVLKENISDIKEGIGRDLLPAITDTAKVLNKSNSVGIIDFLIGVGAGGIEGLKEFDLLVVNLVESIGLLAKGTKDIFSGDDKATKGIKGFALPETRLGNFDKGGESTLALAIRAKEAQEAIFQTNKARGEAFIKAHERVTLSSSEFAIAQFEKEARSFESLIKLKVIKQEDFDEFRTNGLRQITLKNNTAFQSMLRAAQDFGDGTTDTFVDWAHGAEISFGSILESFSRMILKMIIQINFIQPMMRRLFGASVAGGTGPGLLGAFITSSGGGGTKSLSLPTVPSSIPFSPSAGFDGINAAEGGVATKPTFGTFGEAGAEALIPLDRFKDFQGGSNVQINIIGAPEGTTTQESDIEGGGKRLDVMLDEAVADNVKHGTKTFQQMQRSFAVNKSLRRR